MKKFDWKEEIGLPLIGAAMGILSNLFGLILTLLMLMYLIYKLAT